METLQRLELDQRIRLTWTDAVELQLSMSKKELNTPLYRQLLEILRREEFESNIQFETKEQFEAVCKAIGGFYGLRPKSIERSMFLQEAFFTAIESLWIDKSFDKIELHDIRKHIIAHPPVTELEFNMIMKSGFYGETTLNSVIEVAQVHVDRVQTVKLHLLPFKKKKYARSHRLTASLSMSTNSKNKKRWCGR